MPSVWAPPRASPMRNEHQLKRLGGPDYAESSRRRDVVVWKSFWAALIDHSMPRSRGKSNTFGNAQSKCGTCNQEKGAKTRRSICAPRNDDAGRHASRLASRRSLVKVTLRLDKSGWHGHATESLWAEPAGIGQCRLKNLPFYAYGASYDDLVRTVQDGDQQMVSGVVEHAGHSTYRVFVSNTDALKDFAEYWIPLEQLGCTLERATARLFAVDVPPTADIHSTYDAMAKGHSAAVWDFEEAHLAHPFVLNGHRAVSGRGDR
jgi:Domain of unknown function (DUF4265)/HNH endonuclease